MTWMERLKPVERWAKTALTYVAALLLWRPGRSAKARELARGARRVLLVRIDNRVGEALLMTPLLDALSGAGLEVTVLVHERCVRVLEGHPSGARVLGFDRRRLALGPLAPGVRAVRGERYQVVVDCPNWTAPSVTSAIISRLVAGAAPVVGPAARPVSALHDLSVAPRPDTRDEVLQRLHLLSPLAPHPEPRALSFRPPREGPAVETVLATLAGARFAVVNPGGRLGFRRVPQAAFIAAARALLEVGRTPVVTWGPGEEALAREVVGGAPGALLAPPTDLDALAALMARAGLTVCNNTGPMHLSVAVGAPTLALFLHMELARWGHDFPPHRMLDLTPLIERPQALEAAVDQAVRALAAATERNAGQRSAAPGTVLGATNSTTE